MFCIESRLSFLLVLATFGAAGYRLILYASPTQGQVTMQEISATTSTIKIALYMGPHAIGFVICGWLFT